MTLHTLRPAGDRAAGRDKKWHSHCPIALTTANTDYANMFKLTHILLVVMYVSVQLVKL